MKILIACEESQTITNLFRAKGYEAYSCDLLDCSGGNPQYHYKGDALVYAYSGQFDMMIAHPPCTFLAVSGARWMYNKDGSVNQERLLNQRKALEFVRLLMNAPIEKIAIENPVSVISTKIRKPDQIVQPYWFGDEARKTTCLWLKNLPLLKPTNIVGKGEQVVYKSGKSHPKWYAEALTKAKTPEERRRLRSKTFPGMANAIVEQWV
tara:strand:+ start:14100 stop:14723 length:624 start_codon:yes stop_codon:yes gene_type:complete